MLLAGPDSPAVRLRMCEDNIQDDLAVARSMCEAAGSIAIHRATYAHVQLDAIRVLTLTDVTNELSMLGRRIERCPVEKLVHDVLSSKRSKKRSQTQPSSRGQARRRTTHGNRGSDSDSSESDFVGIIPPPVEGDGVEEAIADWAEAQGDAAAARHALFFNPAASPQVREGGPDGHIVGRISQLKVGTPQECISVYCRHHQCSKLVRITVAPHTDAMLQWLADGRECQNQRQHLAKWPAVAGGEKVPRCRRRSERVRRCTFVGAFAASFEHHLYV